MFGIDNRKSTRNGHSVGRGAPQTVSPSEEFKFLLSLTRELVAGEVNLPCFPDVVIRVRKALDRTQNSAQNIVDIASSEPRLAARLLQLANSAAYNTGAKPVTELRTAIIRLGRKSLQNAVMAYALQELAEAPKLRPYAMELKILWRDSLCAAVLCKELSAFSSVNADEAFLAGLLHGIGTLYILSRLAQAEAPLSEDLTWLAEAGSWRASIGKAILENWKFKEDVCEAVGEQNNQEYCSRGGKDLCDILICALVLAQAINRPERGLLEITGIRSFQTLGLTEESCLPLLASARLKLREVHQTLGFLPKS